MAAAMDAPRRPQAGAFLRFLVVGGLSYVVDLGSLLFLYGLAGAPLAAATTGAFAIAFVLTFTLNRLWVFDAASGGVSGQVVRYLALVGLNYLATLVIVLGLTAAGAPVAVSKTVAVAVIAVANYFLYRHFVFREPARVVDTLGVPPVEEKE